MKPGWYPDPDMADTQRFYDGEDFTEHVAPEERPREISTWKGLRSVALGILCAVAVLVVAATAFGVLSPKPEVVSCSQQRAEYDAGERELYELSSDCTSLPVELLRD